MSETADIAWTLETCGASWATETADVSWTLETCGASWGAFKEGVQAAIDNYLLESGDTYLLESGDNIDLEG